MVDKVKKSELATQPQNRGAILMQQVPGIDDDDLIARKLTRPEVTGAASIRAWTGENHEINALVRELEIQSAAVKRGDMGRTEEMLISQAHVLDEIFSTLARKAYGCMGKSDVGFELCLRLGFKAQSQCRATLETLAEIKNPWSGAYIKQANLAAGHQQVNNGPEGTRVREIESTQNRLSGELHELRPNTRTPALASRVDQALEALGEVNWTDDGGREATG